MNYSNRLKAYRKLNSLNQEKLAELIGVASNTYSFKENGKVEFSLNEAKKIADLFGVTIDELFFGKEVRVKNT
ncbi:transcriptional regulator [Clostridium perfringens]|uniref:Helix-turn-helix transcriptional regulator n=1 Tax=Clostridium perfringens TaxID=1502 RepID=A0AAP4A3L5_CLOPF|nr:helix-turn-helix transcriptional regulator [Clostridium perfringens]DAL12855.1 MAG TPA_asm: putative transcriptional regulator [Caudoviricetes sp.]EJT5930474.1 helix-turn-helix transcriptional regulator [Clostridium perfringens]EJT6161737.1 helix-turn-helix transcriptional regulator [Clostridium perfringens]EJT6504218.1 helix-turn-helix transcriptional regulator [Clostridium perfringens]ELC8346218.1 helix-turn-helix transcriptional regulator [Clostridium perfringens]